MRYKLLKELRKEARSNIFIIPISGDTNRCVIKVCEVEPDPCCSRSVFVRNKYYFREGEEDVYQEGSIPGSLRLKSKSTWRQPYTLQQAVDRVYELRQEYIIKRAQEMRLTWKNSDEIIQTWVLKKII